MNFVADVTDLLAATCVAKYIRVQIFKEVLDEVIAVENTHCWYFYLVRTRTKEEISTNNYVLKQSEIALIVLKLNAKMDDLMIYYELARELSA